MKGPWCAAVLCRSHLQPQCLSLCAAAWCTLLFLRPTPNILVSKCKTVVVCIFLYFFCTSWRIAENISFAVWTQWLGWSYEWQDAKCLYVWKQMEGIHTACPSPLLCMETGCSFLSVAPFQKENILKTQCLYDILLYYFSSYFSSDVTIIHEHVFCFNDCWRRQIGLLNVFRFLHIYIHVSKNQMPMFSAKGLSWWPSLALCDGPCFCYEY